MTYPHLVFSSSVTSLIFSSIVINSRQLPFGAVRWNKRKKLTYIFILFPFCDYRLMIFIWNLSICMHVATCTRVRIKWLQRAKYEYEYITFRLFTCLNGLFVIIILRGSHAKNINVQMFINYIRINFRENLGLIYLSF